MKKFLLTSIFITLGFLLVGSQVVIAESDDAKKELVRQSIEVWNTGDASMAKDIFTKDFTFNMVDHKKPVLKGYKAVLAYAKFLRGAYPNMKYEPNWMVVDGDKVITQMSFTGTNTGPRGKAPATNKTVELESILIAEIKDGKISEEWVFTNEATIYRQLGMTTIP